MLSANKLKYLRLLYNLTQKDLAAELNITDKYISMIENNKVNFTEEWCNKYVLAIYKLATTKK